MLGAGRCRTAHSRGHRCGPVVALRWTPYRASERPLPRHKRFQVSDRFSVCVIGMAAVVAVLSLTCVTAAGLTSPVRFVGAAEASGGGAQATRAQAGCPEESARFHPCALARAKTFDPPRTSDGEPDLQGFWRGPSSGNESIEEHPKTLDDSGGASLIVDPPDGRVPYRAPAAPQPKKHRETYLEPNTACFLSGVPRSLYVPTHIQILQFRGYVVILFERAHAYRIIPTSGGPHVGERIPLWQGDSRGGWEGNTLVVDVTNQNAKTWFDQAGNFSTDAVHMIERFTLIDPDVIHYEVTIEDPNVYTRPWKMVLPLMRNKEEAFRLLEEACHEGEQNAQPLLDRGYRIYPGVTTKKPW